MAGYTATCYRAEQVFIGGIAQTQLADGATPGAGQFARVSASDRRLVLGSSPGSGVEVSTRTTWMSITTSNVTVTGFTMRYAATPFQGGALLVGSVDNVVLSGLTLTDSASSNVRITSGTGNQIKNSELARGGQEALNSGRYPAAGTVNLLIQGNTIHDNNTERFNPGWEAGGVKVAHATSPTFDGNTVYGNIGPGLWCDVGCDGSSVFSNNVVHHNYNSGIMFEGSTGATIFGNKVWENGWEAGPASQSWGWGAGILISSSANADVFDNIVAWNAEGIFVASQNRLSGDPPAPYTKNVNVHSNTITLKASSNDASDALMLGWAQDWDGHIWDASSNNRGSLNTYWRADPEPAPGNFYPCRFSWGTGQSGHCYSNLSDFNATGGEEGAVYLTTPQRDALLSAAGLPTAPEAR